MSVSQKSLNVPLGDDAASLLEDLPPRTSQSMMASMDAACAGARRSVATVRVQVAPAALARLAVGADRMAQSSLHSTHKFPVGEVQCGSGGDGDEPSGSMRAPHERKPARPGRGPAGEVPEQPRVLAPLESSARVSLPAVEVFVGRTLAGGQSLAASEKGLPPWPIREAVLVEVVGGSRGHPDI